MAVGFTFSSTQKAIAESWNGKTWRGQRLPRTGENTRFLGVSCPAARACMAVGYQTSSAGSTRPFAASWNGRAWRVRTVPLPAAALFDAVSCTTPAGCTATGTQLDTGTTLAERWNGKAWRIQPTPNPADFRTSISEIALTGVSCTSAKRCTASADYSPGGPTEYFVESWNGTSWQLKPTPQPAGFQHGALLAVSCAPTRCTAVGAYTGKVRLQVTLALAH